MLKKLIKHDFMNTWKVITFLCAIVLVAGIVLSVLTMFEVGSKDGLDVVNILAFLLFLAYVVAIPTIAVIAIIYLVSYYRKKLYSNQGYLSFTLPVRNSQVVLSKMIVSGIWMVLGHICVLASITMVVAAATGNDFFMKFGETTGNGDLYIAITALSIPNLLSYFFSISVGQTRRKNKTAWAVICQFIIYFILLVWMIFELRYIGEVSWHRTGQQIAEMITIKSIIYSIVLSLFFGGGSAFIVNKKLNLE